MSAAVDTISPPTPNLFAGLVAAQRVAKIVAKDGKVEHGTTRYKYATSEDVIEEARAALAAGELALFAERAELREVIPGGGEGDKYEPPLFSVSLTYVLAHGSGQSHKITSETFVMPEKGRPFDKALAAAKTYDLAYTLRTLLLLPRGEEDNPDQRDDRNWDPRGQRQAPKQQPPKREDTKPKAPPAPAAPPTAAPAEAAKPAAASNDEFRSWWQALQGLQLSGEQVKALTAEMFAGRGPRDLNKDERARLYTEAAQRKAKGVLEEARR